MIYHICTCIAWDMHVLMLVLDGKPMIRNGETGDWIGTFLGHKGAVWCARLDPTASVALTGSADYTAYEIIFLPLVLRLFMMAHI